MASRFFVAAKRGFLRPRSSSFMNYRSQLHIFNSTSSSINQPQLRHRLIDVEFMHHESPYMREDKEREWERGRMDSINGGIAGVHKLNYSPEAHAELEKLIRQVEDEKAARNECTTDWKLGYEDRGQRVNHLYNELRKMDLSWAKLDEILLAGKETESLSDESTDNGPGFAKNRTEEAVVIARPEEEEKDFPRVNRELDIEILVLILITFVGVYVFGPVFLPLLPILPFLLMVLLAISPVLLIPLIVPLLMLLMPLILPLLVLLLPIFPTVVLPILLFLCVAVMGMAVMLVIIMFLDGFQLGPSKITGKTKPSDQNDRLSQLKTIL